MNEIHSESEGELEDVEINLVGKFRETAIKCSERIEIYDSQVPSTSKMDENIERNNKETIIKRYC